MDRRLALMSLGAPAVVPALALLAFVGPVEACCRSSSCVRLAVSWALRCPAEAAASQRAFSAYGASPWIFCEAAAVMHFA